MYQKILNELTQGLRKGGGFVEISKDDEHPIWLVLVKDMNNNVYFGYTVGAENKDFFFELFEFSKANNFFVKIVMD